MILDLGRFIETERPQWQALEKTLTWLDADPSRRMSLEESAHFHALYERAAEDLTRIEGFVAEGELKQYLSWLVSRAYAEIHESRQGTQFRPWRWVSADFPQAFRRHI